MPTTTSTLQPALAADPAFSPGSRLWIYTADRELSEAEAQQAQQSLDAFARQWTAHNNALHAGAEVFNRRFVLLMVDESRAGASGCSIDKSVHFLEDLGHTLGLDLFNRMLFGWVNENGKIEVADRAAFTALVREGRIADDTLVVNTLAATRQDLTQNWLLPFGQSWQKRLV